MIDGIGKENKGAVVPALFMHIQKTAGTSIVQMMARHYGRLNVSSHGDFVGSGPDSFAGMPFVSGHFGYSYAERLMRNRYSFTFLRDPVERTLSFYYFCRTRSPEEAKIYRLAGALPLEEFLQALSRDRVLRWFVYNTQVWYLAYGPGDESTRVNYIRPFDLLERALENVEKFSFVGLTESVDDDSKVIFRALNMPPDSVVDRSNVTDRTGGQRDIPASTYEFIEELTQLDHALYDAVLARRHFQHDRNL